MSRDETGRARRERSVRYPGVPLGESLEFCRTIAGRGLAGRTAAGRAEGLGYTSGKTSSCSARRSAARQFGLLAGDGQGYRLTALARSILHPIEPGDLPGLFRQALQSPPLY